MTKNVSVSIFNSKVSDCALAAEMFLEFISSLCAELYDNTVLDSTFLGRFSENPLKL
jgi:hypothetical protein